MNTPFINRLLVDLKELDDEFEDIDVNWSDYISEIEEAMNYNCEGIDFDRLEFVKTIRRPLYTLNNESCLLYRHDDLLVLYMPDSRMFAKYKIETLSSSCRENANINVKLLNHSSEYVSYTLYTGNDNTNGESSTLTIECIDIDGVYLTRDIVHEINDITEKDADDKIIRKIKVNDAIEIHLEYDLDAVQFFYTICKNNEFVSGFATNNDSTTLAYCDYCVNAYTYNNAIILEMMEESFNGYVVIRGVHF